MLLVAVAGCGRVAFDPLGDAARDAARDAAADVAFDANLPVGLVAWYPLDEVSGTRFHDVIGAHDGGCTFGSCPTPTQGHHGGAMHFDGVTNCIDIADAGQLELPAFTIAVWAKQEIVAGGNGMTQFAKRVDVMAMALDSWQLEDLSANTVQFTTNHGATTNEYAYSPVPKIILGTWQHLAGTWDGAMTRVYADGVLAASQSHPAPIAYDAHPGLIGCDDNAGIAENYQGTLDDLQIYNRALADTEIAQLAGM